jgi:HEAT repeat protein
VALLTACAAPQSRRAAQNGDFAGVRAAIASERSRGVFDNDRARDLARAVADREIRTSRGLAAAARIDEARACATELTDSLERRAKGKDDDAAQATLVLLDTQKADVDGARLWKQHADDLNPLWRAVAARAQVGLPRGAMRRKSYVDADERVRLAALRAALEAVDPADAAPLLEAARLDPNHLAQSLAARAAGAIGSPRVVIGLRDIYGTADEGLRQSIVDGWARPAAASAGGMRELEQTASNEHGSPSIEAAANLLRFGGEPATLGTVVLVRSMSEGLARDRVLAVNDAPVNDLRVVSQLETLEHGRDPAVRAAALGRLAEVPASRNRALVELRSMAAQGGTPALFALARAHDRAAIPMLERRLTAPKGDDRAAAARALSELGEPARAADLLADPDPRVRMTVSCAILSAPKP